MRIALVNSHDLGGGAAGFTRQLAAGLRARGHDVAMVVGIKKTDLPWVYEVPVTGGGGTREALLRGLLRRVLPKETAPFRTRYFARRLLHAREWRGTLARRRGREDFRLPGSARVFSELPFKPDIIHLNNLHYFVGPTHFDIHQLPLLGKDHRFVYTLHDTWSFTGHCAYFFECQRWRDSCGSCPHLDIYPALKKDGSTDNLRTKAAVYRELSLTLTTPSRWLMDCARDSILEPAMRRAEVVPYGIDLEFFKPSDDRERDREALGIAPDERAICFVADNGRATPWRDFGFVEKLVEAYQSENPERKVVVLEAGSSVFERTRGRVRQVGLGRLPAEGVRRVFQAADLMVYPAKADNFPYVILESLACGTPVLASRAGGVPEEFVDGESGFVFDPGDLATAKERLSRVMSDPALRERMRGAARAHAVASFGIDRMVADYERIYSEV